MLIYLKHIYNISTLYTNDDSNLKIKQESKELSFHGKTLAAPMSNKYAKKNTLKC